MRNRKGLTLVELIVTLAIASIVIPLIYSIFFVATSSHSISTNKGFAQQDIRIAADFITNELRTVTDISEVEFGSNEYYSLKINSEGNLVKSKLIRQLDDTLVETTVNTISGNLSSMNIINNVEGVIDIKMEQTEKAGSKEAGFDLTMAISTENSSNMLSNVSLDLVDGDVLYYQNTMMNSLSDNIYLNKQGEVDGESVTVRFYRNDGTSNLYRTISGNSGSMESLPTIPVRVGYTFTKWNTQEDGSGISYGSVGGTTFEIPTNNTDVYAIWAASGVLDKVVIEINSGTDGIVKIGTTDNPEKVGGRFIVDRKDGGLVKVKLAGYDAYSHKDQVTVTVTGTKNVSTTIQESGYVVFTAVSQGNQKGDKFDVEISIKTAGHKDIYTEKYKFINSD